jgi:ABC-type branched-subunit amino acid transport system substrate-binding protein
MTSALGLGLAVAIGAIGTVRAAEPYDIHVTLPLTGSGAFLGKGHRDSLDTLADIVDKSGGIAGRPVRSSITTTNRARKWRCSSPTTCSPRSRR